MADLFCIVYRTGGTENFQWHRSLPMTRWDADAALAAERRAGRTSSMLVNYRQSLAVGLPDTFGTPNRTAAFSRDSIDFYACPSQGAFFGVGRWEGKEYLAIVAMLADGSPETGDLAIGEVCNFDDNQAALDEVNALLGTAFPMSKFPGR